MKVIEFINLEDLITEDYPLTIPLGVDGEATVRIVFKAISEQQIENTEEPEQPNEPEIPEEPEQSNENENQNND